MPFVGCFNCVWEHCERIKLVYCGAGCDRLFWDGGASMMGLSRKVLEDCSVGGGIRSEREGEQRMACVQLDP